MSNTREIITLQFGNYANYVGTHYWNIQESGFNYDPNAPESEINHDVLFREGKNFKGEVTYTPRLLLVDQKGVLKHYPEEGELYTNPLSLYEENAVEEMKLNMNWDSKSVDVIMKPQMRKPDYQNDLSWKVQTIRDNDYKFNENVETWTDYIYSRYHPRTINILRDFEHSKDNNSFDTYTTGNATWKNNYFDDDFSDKIRQYIEETDFCQGFQVFFDCTDGFSGLTLSCLEYLQDDYSYSVLAVPLVAPKITNFQNADSAMTDSIRLVNIAMTYSNLNNVSSLILPLSTMSKGWRQISQPRKFPLLNYEAESFYQSSSILATYLETISLRYRLASPCGSNFLPGFCSDLNNYGRKLSGGGLALPFQMNSAEDLIDCLDNINGPLFTDISPNTEIGTDRIIQSVSVRGIPKDRLKRPRESAQKQMQMAAYKCESVSEMLQLYFQCNNYNSMSHVSSIQLPMTVKTPYPFEMFSQQINSEGFISQFELKKRELKNHIFSAPIFATVQNSSKISDTLESLHREASRIKIQKIHRFKETGLEKDDYEEILNSLLEFKDNYDDTFDL